MCSKPIEAISKRKSKRRVIGDILGNFRAESKNRRGGRKKCGKSATFRSAIASISLSISDDAIVNRNRIILNEKQACWEIGKLLGIRSNEPDDEVVSKLHELDNDGTIHEQGDEIQGN